MIKFFKQSKSMVCGLVASGLLVTLIPQLSFAQTQRWSDVFGNAGPNATVHIRSGQNILIDQNIDVGGIIIEGELTAQDNRNLTVSTDWALVVNGGLFQVGSSNNPFEHDFTLTLTGDNPNRDLDLRRQVGMRINNNDAFLMAMGRNSRIRLFGADAAKRSWTQISATVRAGARSFTVADATGWQVGDKIAIASTALDWTEAEELTIASISGRNITVRERIQHRHYGEIERYSNGTRSWDIDMRAEVGLLSRNVTITGDEDAHRNQVGGHLMVSNNASLQISGTELTRMGQFGVLGRYPVHYHLLGNAGSGQFVANSSIHHTYNKGATIHGTHNTRFDQNVVFDTIGHSLYLEDGNEVGNVITDNLIFSTREARRGAAVISDERQAASFWIQHPNNIMTGNHAAGSASAAFWIFGHDAPLGDSTGQNPPGDFSDMVFDNNTVHSSGEGVFIDGRVERGTNRVRLGPISPRNRDNLVLTNTTAFKIRTGRLQGAMWARIHNVTIDNFMSADNGEGVFLHARGYLLNSVIVAESNGNAGEAFQEDQEQRGIRLYVGGSSVLSNVHFDGFNQKHGNSNWKDWDVAIHGRRNSDRAMNHVRGLTFADTPRDQQFTWGLDRGRDRAILDHDGSLTGQAGTIWSFRQRGGGARQVTDMAAPIWASRGNNIPSWRDAVNGVLEFNFRGDPDPSNSARPTPAPTPVTVAAAPAAAPGSGGGSGGVTLYNENSFRGNSLALGTGSYNIAVLIDSGVGNDDVSSIRIADGWSIRACEHGNFGGNCNVYSSSRASLGNFNDVISSFQVIAP